MLGTVETVDAVVEALGHVGEAPVVVDPVMVSESGAVLLDEDGPRGAGRAAAAAGRGGDAEPPRGAGADRGGGGGLAGGARPRGAGARARRRWSSPAATASANVDLFYDGREAVPIEGERHPGGASHGSGCTHSSALAARLALGDSPLEAARAARRIASEAVGAGLRELGEGPGRSTSSGSIGGRSDSAQ